jgi:hypothetical protein
MQYQVLKLAAIREAEYRLGRQDSPMRSNAHKLCSSINYLLIQLPASPNIMIFLPVSSSVGYFFSLTGYLQGGFQLTLARAWVISGRFLTWNFYIFQLKTESVIQHSRYS